MRTASLQQGLLVLSLAAAGSAVAQATQQVVRPPQAQAWIDVATFSGFGMPAPGGNPMAAMGSLFGGAGSQGANSFGRTQAGQAGRWVDVTLSSRANPSLGEAEQAVPAGFMDAPLKLLSPKDARAAPAVGDDTVEPAPQPERPRGRFVLYWGCGAAVRPGQPKVLDLASASPAEMAQFFQARRATQRGAHSAAGRPDWPSTADTRMVAAGASLVGTHAFSAASLVPNFRFNIPPAQDLMPALSLQQQPADGATELSWAGLPTARAYFIAAMGASERQDMILWTSSELPETGFGLLDYQTNATVDRWLGEKVLLAPATTRCTMPKGVFPENTGGMLRMIAYGNELNLVHPPRPADPKQPWEQEWAVKVRVKSMTTAMLGAPAEAMPAQGQPPQPGTPQPPDEQRPKPLDILRGILGR